MSKSRVKKPKELLQFSYDSSKKWEICIDEVARGCLFGRVYVAAVVLPSDDSFDGTEIKDSKKFSSKIKMKEVSDYIHKNCLAYHIHYIESDVIDEINILQAVFRCMHECVKEVIAKLENANPENTLIVVDGDRFKPYCIYNDEKGTMEEIPHVTIEQGDAKYMGIAAASIIAKVAHDEYIYELCKNYPLLNERYHLEKNVGYGTKQHLDGIKQHGITQLHRKSYGICKTAQYSPL
jgi:ribonuclease HII